MPDYALPPDPTEITTAMLADATRHGPLSTDDGHGRCYLIVNDRHGGYRLVTPDAGAGSGNMLSMTPEMAVEFIAQCRKGSLH